MGLFPLGQWKARVVDVLDDLGFDVKVPPILEHHYCDGLRCGARAYLWAEVNGTELAYCRHHGNQYFDALMLAGRILLDTRDTVLQKPKVAADD